MPLMTAILSLMSPVDAPVTVPRLVELARTLSAEDRRRLVIALKGEALEQALGEEDARRAGHREVSDEEIQAEIDKVRERLHQDLNRAPSG